MLIEPLVLIFILELLSWPSRVVAAAAAKSKDNNVFRLLKMEQLTNEFFRRNSDRGRRPKPSDELPIEDLHENKSLIYDPFPSEINIKLLRRQLGRAYDKRYMSIYSPSPKKQSRHFSIPFKKGRPAFGKRPKFLKRLRSARLQDGRKIKLNVGKKDRRKFQKYIWSLTFCPVKRSWKDLGIRFWPRWIRKGSCSSERSCSIPEGMKCKPSDSTQLTFLRWYCSDYHSRKGCKWIHVKYPVITACSCRC